jgi:hypothetical protein
VEVGGVAEDPEGTRPNDEESSLRRLPGID